MYHEDYEVNTLKVLPVTDKKLEEFRGAIAEDEDMNILLQYAETEWPNDKMQVRESLRSYCPYRDEVHAKKGLLLRSNRLMSQENFDQRCSAFCTHHMGASR